MNRREHQRQIGRIYYSRFANLIFNTHTHTHTHTHSHTHTHDGSINRREQERQARTNHRHHPNKKALTSQEWDVRWMKVCVSVEREGEGEKWPPHPSLPLSLFSAHFCSLFTSNEMFWTPALFILQVPCIDVVLSHSHLLNGETWESEWPLQKADANGTVFPSLTSHSTSATTGQPASKYS